MVHLTGLTMDAVHIPTLYDLQRLAGLPANRHPGFLITRIEDLPPLPRNFPRETTYGFYNIGLKRQLNGYLQYGRSRYDFQEGVMGFCAPHQMVGHDPEITQGASGWFLFFDPDLLSGHPLAETIQRYHFFQYQIHEALHLSQEEEASVEAIFANLLHEYQQPIDQHSKAIVLSNLELLLSYSQRFYSRQFLIRQAMGSDLMSRFEGLLHDYFQSSIALEGLPSVGYFAAQLHVSPNYLSDLLRTLTGKSTQEHIHLHVIQKAKHQLIGTTTSVAEIAYSLGFTYPSHFSKLFKTKTGYSPTAYRLEQGQA